MLIFVLSVLIVAGCSSQPTNQEIPSTGNNSLSTPTAGLLNLQQFNELFQAIQTYGGAVVEAGSISQPFFNVDGKILQVNDQQIQVFEFANAADAKASASQISDGGTTIGNTKVTWVSQPHFWLSGKMIVLYIGNDPYTITMLDRLMGKQIGS